MHLLKILDFHINFELNTTNCDRHARISDKRFLSQTNGF